MKHTRCFARGKKFAAKSQRRRLSKTSPFHLHNVAGVVWLLDPFGLAAWAIHCVAEV